MLYVAVLGLVMSIKFHAPDWLGGVPWLSWGRLRYAHTQGLFFGWLGNAFLAFLYFVVPRLAARPVTSVRLGWALFAVWNGLLVLPGWALVQAGVSQPLEWAEFPLPGRRRGDPGDAPGVRPVRRARCCGPGCRACTSRPGTSWAG